jgi:hypothetical protein
MCEDLGSIPSTEKEKEEEANNILGSSYNEAAYPPLKSNYKDKILNITA